MTLGWYLSKTVGLRILATGIVLLLLGLGIDLLRMASTLIERGGAPALLDYAMLRAPLIATTLFPIAALTGAVVAFLALGGRSELTVIRAAGLSTFRILATLAPLALAMGIFYSILGDRISAWAENTLEDMFAEEPEETTPTLSPDPVWSRDSREVVRAYLANPEGTELRNITLFKLDEDGHLQDRLSVRTARFDGTVWMLDGITSGPSDAPILRDSRAWDTTLRPADIQALAAGRRSASVKDARAVLSGNAAATRGRSYYSTRIARSYAAFFVPAIMILLAALAGFGSARAGGRAKLAVTAVVLGFLYITADGFVASLGEVGAIDPLIAAFAPGAFFAIVGIWSLILFEA